MADKQISSAGDNRPFRFQKAKRGRKAGQATDLAALAASVAGWFASGKIAKPTDFNGVGGRPRIAQVNTGLGGYNRAGTWAEGYLAWCATHKHQNSPEAVREYCKAVPLPTPSKRPGSAGGSGFTIPA